MLCTVGLAAQTPTANQTKFFEEKIRPLLIRNCYECHGEQKQKSNLRVDSLSHLLKGGDSGAAVIPGKPEESLLMAAVQRMVSQPMARLSTAMNARPPNQLFSAATHG